MKNVAQAGVSIPGISHKNPKAAWLRKKVAWVAAWLILASSAQADYVPYDPNTINQYGVSAYGYVNPHNTFNRLASSTPTDQLVSVVYDAVTIPDFQWYSWKWTLWSLDTWGTNPFDLIIEALDTSTGQIIDIWADFWVPIWDTPDTFRFVDKWSGTTLNGIYNVNNWELSISNWFNAVFTFNAVQWTIPAIPEPWILYLMIPGLVWVYFMTKKNQKNK